MSWASSTARRPDPEFGEDRAPTPVSLYLCYGGATPVSAFVTVEQRRA